MCGISFFTKPESSIHNRRDVEISIDRGIDKEGMINTYMHTCIKKAEHRRIDAFELWYWRSLLRVPRRPNQSILKEISPEYSLEGLML